MGRVFASSDRALAIRMETAESANGLEMARAVSRSHPDAAAEPFAGGTAVFAGVGSPMTHALGIGLRGSVSEDEMERMEDFFRERGSACLIDLCPLADPAVIAFVQSRPYRVIEFNNVLARRIEPREAFEPVAGLRPVPEAEIALWSRVITQGFSEHMPVTDEMVAVMEAACGSSQCWLAGEEAPVGGAAMGIRDGVALFYGDATLLAARGKGWQAGYIRERLAAAQRQGCDLAMASVLPGSGSHRNYERAGFELIYMRVNLMREFNS